MLRPLVFLVLLLPVAAIAQYESELRDAGSLGAIRLAGTEDPGASKVYIVQLAMPSAAQFHAQMLAASNVPGAQSTTQRMRLDKNSAAIQSYTSQVAEAQNKVITRAGAGTQLIYRYRFGLNGVV